MQWFILALAVCGVAGLGQTYQPTVSLEDRLVYGLTEYMHTGKESADLRDAFDSIQAPYELRNFGTTARNTAICTLCNVVARLLLNYRQSGAPIDLLSAAVKKLCTNAKIESENVCNGVIDLNIDIFLYIIDNKPDLTPAKICGTIAQPFGCALPANDGNWTVALPPGLEKPLAQNNYAAKEDKPISILQITDIHYDDIYVPGSNALCGEPLCCAANQGEPATSEARAGFWGDYRNCDMPWHSVLNLMKQLSTHDNVDYMYYTGDIVSHRVWATSIESNMQSIKKLYAQFRQSFPSTTIFPILGNHEPNPLNEFTTTDIQDPHLTTQWLYDLVAEEWSHWLPESTKETIRKGGYYTVLVKPGFRIIALNSNVGYTFNWWLLHDDKALQEQLQWLSDTLYEAEKSGEQVHILSHVPTGDNTCLTKWSHEYYRIIQRFAHVISAQFVGHTHFDEMNLYFNNSDIMEPMSVAYNGGSFTSYVNVNPNYKLYDISPTTWEVTDFHAWTFNLTEANQNYPDLEPVWYKLYSFKEAYGLESMSLHELGKFLRNMPKDQSILDTFFRFKYREGDLYLAEGCNQACHEENMCTIVTTEFGKTKLCDELTLAYRDTLKRN
ncbi:uncharacterized protein CBL_04813 [Carabus blaptoides fortunei]